MNLGEMLKEFRKINKLRLIDVSEALGIKTSNLCRYEKNTRLIPERQIPRIKKYIQQDYEEIVKIQKEKEEQKRIEEEKKRKELEELLKEEAKYSIFKNIRFLIPIDEFNKELFEKRFDIRLEKEILKGRIINIKHFKITPNRKNIILLSDIKGYLIENENYIENWYENWKKKYIE